MIKKVTRDPLIRTINLDYRSLNLRGTYRPGMGIITINRHLLVSLYSEFWLRFILQPVIQFSLPLDKVDISLTINGGGIQGRRIAIRVAILRAILRLFPNLLTSENKRILRPFYTLDTRRRMPTRFLRRGARAKPQLSFR